MRLPERSSTTHLTGDRRREPGRRSSTRSHSGRQRRWFGVATFVHIVDVEESWLHEQLLGEGVKNGPDPNRYRDIEAVAAIWEQAGADWESYLAGMTEYDLTKPFAVAPGVSVPTFVIALHVFNHTTHHRAEIWTALTSFGERPPQLEVLDYADPRQ